MSSAAQLLPWIPAVPAISALVAAVFGRRLGRSLVGPLAVSSVGISFLLAAVVFALEAAASPDERSTSVALFTWVAAGSFKAEAALLLDPLSALMILVVSGVGFLIHIYSLGYMAGDRDFSRYFAYLNLFMAAMLLLVLAENLLLMFVGWEGVGLCSYLLIGFWFERKSAADAGKKAFIVNRVGDFGFLLGILLAFASFESISFREFLPRVGEHDPALLNLVASLLFLGAIGKSAQIPLYVWLPDAMEGPTPVSALIHAATMVTAGVYMVARTSPLYAQAPFALALIGAVGAATALYAASIALAQNDFKRVLAYSTVSQLGYMFLACGVGAFAAAIFHLVTHAFFKALLFLCAGSVMHALAGETNIQRMGGLRKLSVTWVTFAVATAAIAGIPPFAGFWSKDEILWGAFREGHRLLWLAGALGAFLTSFYMGRLYFLVFEGSFRGGPALERHLHESPPSMAWPLRLLAIGSLLVGFIGVPHFSWIENFLAPSLATRHAGEGWTVAEGALMVFSVLIALGGLGLALYLYWLHPERPERIAARLGGLYRLVRDKYRIDELYDALVVRPTVATSRVLLWRAIDVGMVDGVVNGSGRAVAVAGELLRLAQTGSLRVYLFFLLAGAVTLFGWLVWV